MLTIDLQRSYNPRGDYKKKLLISKKILKIVNIEKRLYFSDKCCTSNFVKSEVDQKKFRICTEKVRHANVKFLRFLILLDISSRT